MVEPKAVTPEDEKVDFGAGTVSTQEQALHERLLDLYEQRRRHRSWFFVAALAFSAAMTAAVLWFGHRLMSLIESNNGLSPDWHFLLLGTGLIVPPTVVLYGLMRRLYELENRENNGKDKSSESPAGEVLSEVGGMVKSVTEMVSAVTGTIGKGSN